MRLDRPPTKKEKFKAFVNKAAAVAKARADKIKKGKRYQSAKAKAKEAAKQGFYLGLAYARKQLSKQFGKKRRKHRKSRRSKRRRR